MSKKSMSGIVLTLSLATLAFPAAAGGPGEQRAAQTVFYGKGRMKSPDEQSYALVRRQGATMIISGNGENVPVDQLKRAIAGDFVWFRDGERAYVIVDPALLIRADRAWELYDTALDTLSSSRRELRKREKLLSQMQSGKTERDAGGEELASKIRAEKKLLAELSQEKSLLEQKRTAAYEQAQLGMRALIDEAVRSGKASAFDGASSN